MTERNVLYGADVNTDLGLTLGELLLEALQRLNDAVLQVDVQTGQEITANELLKNCHSLSKWMQRQGFVPGDTVTVCCENSIEFTIIFCSVLISGLTLAPVNPGYTAGELQHMFKITKPKLIFYTPTTKEVLRETLKAIESSARTVSVGQSDAEGAVLLEDILAEDLGAFTTPALDVIDNVAAIMCSSGTTGLPKGVMLSQFNIIAMLCIMKKVASDNESASIPGVSIGLIPFFHSMGLLCNLISVLGGTKLILFKKFSWKQFLMTIQDHKITTLVIPPPIVVMLCQNPEVKDYDLSSLEYIKTSTASLSKELQTAVSEKYKLEVTQGYGLTEGTFGVLLIPAVNKFGSVGKIVPAMKIKVIDKGGNALGPNEPGEICLSGPLVMKGYADNPEATAEAIPDGDWLHTGDVGYYDEEEYFFIVDRLRELVKYKGFQVPPAELENILLTHPAVHDCAVVGLADDLAGELPLAYVALKPDAVKPMEEELQQYTNSKVSIQKHLRGGVRFIEEIPRNATGKILRRILKEKAKETFNES